MTRLQRTLLAVTLITFLPISGILFAHDEQGNNELSGFLGKFQCK